MKKSFLLLLLFQLPVFLFVFGQPKQPVKVTDMLKIKTASGVSLNKSGTQALFSVNVIEPDGAEHKYVNQLWLVNTDGQQVPWQLTSKENASQAAWSPDGKQIAFVRAAGGKPQLFLISTTGGEARQLTHFKYGASSPVWSPDGKQLIFSAGLSFAEMMKDSVLNPGGGGPAWPFEKPGIGNTALFSKKNIKADPDGSLEQIRSYLQLSADDKKARVLNKLNFQNEMDVSDAMNFNHLFIISIDNPAKPKALTKGFYRFGNAAFLPSGKQIIFSGNMDSLQHPDRSLESSIFLMNADGSGMKTLLAEKGKSFNSPRISPSGKWLAFIQGTTSFVSIPVLSLLPLGSANAAISTIAFDRNKSNLTWSHDEKYIYFTAQSNGGTLLCRADVAAKTVATLTEPDAGIGSFDLVQNRLVYAKTEVANPSEIYIADAQVKNDRRVTELNTGWLKDRQLSFPEKKTFVNDKGLTVEYWIMKPVNYEPGKKYPLLLEIHGGPSSMWGPGEASMWHEYQFFCSKGYGVVYSNPRGSGGYGEAFLRANVNDWGAGPTSDVLTALDKTVAAGWADTAKLFVTGGSYAGYLVSWIIAHDKRFRAACAQRGVYDLTTFFGEGNAWRLVPNYFGGYPWEEGARQILERESPINYVQNITTPLIIFHGENDRRTGVIQSEMLYRSLKVLNRPVEYVRHPGATHEITRSGNNRQRIDQMLRTWEFFERWKE
ncbi:MAG TPA: S9 family peptidase [Chitinophagaceae bacterium]|nr:S9 family peptidase [Chitinophagaceae bacterium]